MKYICTKDCMEGGIQEFTQGRVYKLHKFGTYQSKFENKEVPTYWFTNDLGKTDDICIDSEWSRNFQLYDIFKSSYNRLVKLFKYDI